MGQRVNSLSFNLMPKTGMGLPETGVLDGTVSGRIDLEFR